jgi:hypothetical protein
MTNNARRMRETKFRIAMAKASFSRKKSLFIRILDSNIRKNK